MDLRKVCITGFMGFVLFHLLTFSWPFLPGKIQTFTSEDYTNYLNNNTNAEPVGCQIDKFSWCESLSQTSIWLFFFMFILTVGGFWSEINISLNTILSHVLGPRQQATQQSIFYTVGAGARLSGPIVISHLYTNSGPQMAWIIEILILVVVIGMWFWLYDRMVPLVPHNEKPELPEKKSKKSMIDSNSREEM